MVLGLQPVSAAAQHRTPTRGSTAAARAYVHQQVQDRVREQGQMGVVVSLWDPKLPQARAFDWRQRAPAIQSMVRRVMAAAPRFRVRRTYVTQPLLAGTVDQEGLRQLAASPIVAEVFPDRVVHAALAQSAPLMGQPQAETAGFDGHGVAIAIIDTGIDYKHPDFGGTPATTFPSAKVVGGRDFANNDSDPMDDNGHGTHVAGIAAGEDTTYRGIAPKATLVAYKVLDSSGAGLSSDVIAAIDQALQDQSLYNIKVINLSLSDGSEWTSKEECDSAPDSLAYSDAVAHGLVVVAAAGNEGFQEGLGFPACLSAVISVGATYDQSFAGTLDWDSCQDVNPPLDSPVCFANRGELLDLYAPGAEITSAKASVLTTPSGSWITEAGTSMAAPHAAGAAACVVNMLSPTDPKAPVDPAAIRHRLRLTGVQVIDPSTHVATPRVDVGDAITPRTDGPDLVVTSVTSSASFGFPGDSLSVTISVKNQGNADAPSSTALVLLSANTVISPQDHVLTSLEVPPLGPGQTYTSPSITVALPSLPAGAYHLGGFADSGYLVSEVNEINNDFRGATINLGACARVVANSIPAFMLKGGTYPISITMANEGAIPWTTAAGFELVAVSPQGNARWGLSRVPLPTGVTVNPGGTVTFSFNVIAPTEPGWYPCHWQMAKSGHVFGEVASGATKVLIADDTTLGQDYPAVSGDLVAYEDYRGLYGADDLPAISVTDLNTMWTTMLPQDIPFPRDQFGAPLPPYDLMDISYQWYPDISGTWVTWMTDDLPVDYSASYYYFQIVAYDLARPWQLPRRLTYDPSNPWDNAFPAIDGSRVVWEDYRNDPNRRWDGTSSDNPDIYIADLTDPPGANNTLPSYRLSSTPGQQFNPRISGNLVVWEDWRDGVQADLYLYDLSLDSNGNGTPNWKEPPGTRPDPDPAEMRLTSTPWDEVTPDISGRRVLWVDYRRDDGTGRVSDIYLRDLDTPSATAVATDPPTIRYQPRIDGTKIVWADLRAGNADIYWLDLATGVSAPIAVCSVSQDVPDISGRRVAYSQERAGFVFNVWTQKLLTNGSVGVHTFTDVTNDYWAAPWIEAIAAHSVSAGYPDGSYQPTIIVTRDQMAVYIARALAGSDALVPTGPPTPSFPDVPVGHWAYKYIEYCFARGVVEGYPDGSYQPDLGLTRGAMAVFVARAIADGDAHVPTGPATPTFPDVAPGYWAYKYIEYCFARGVVRGYPDGTYRPETEVGRDQMAVYIARAFGYPA
jgi:beta propeller repeat protein